MHDSSDYDWTQLQDLKRRLEYVWRRNISWEEIAKRASVGDATLKRIAYGYTKEPRASTADAICRFFHSALAEAGGLEPGEVINIEWFRVKRKNPKNKIWATPYQDVAQIP